MPAGLVAADQPRKLDGDNASVGVTALETSAWCEIRSQLSVKSPSPHDLKTTVQKGSVTVGRCGYMMTENKIVANLQEERQSTQIRGRGQHHELLRMTISSGVLRHMAGVAPFTEGFVWAHYLFTKIHLRHGAVVQHKLWLHGRNLLVIYDISYEFGESQS